MIGTYAGNICSRFEAWQPMSSPATAQSLGEFVVAKVLARCARPGLLAIDLGAGPGELRRHLNLFGCEIIAVDRDPAPYRGKHRVVTQDLNPSEFASELGAGPVHLVVALEVIEHVESAINFLRNSSRLLSPNGVGVITSPHVHSMPARLKFVLASKIRTMDDLSAPTHISLIFSGWLRRQFLPRACLTLRERPFYPPNGYRLSRKPMAWTKRLAANFVPGDAVLGDHPTFVLRAAR
jgi:SAM-dependent methyltransferase